MHEQIHKQNLNFAITANKLADNKNFYIFFYNLWFKEKKILTKLFCNNLLYNIKLTNMTITEQHYCKIPKFSLDFPFIKEQFSLSEHAKQGISKQETKQESTENCRKQILKSKTLR